ncbi:MAG: hypothetical protein AABO41_05865 [Acidobacteriota bacterium]
MLSRRLACRNQASINRHAKRVDSRRGAIALVLVLCCVGFAVRALNGWKHASAKANPPVSAFPSSARSSSQGVSKEPARVVKFSLFDAGIYPREVHVDKGLIAITIEDYSGGTTALVVERETGNAPEQVGSVGRAGGHWRGRSEIRLGPGRYQVRMADRPDNRALLVVEP